MTAPHDGARGDARKRHNAPTCLVCGNSVPVDASALAAAKAEGRAEVEAAMVSLVGKWESWALVRSTPRINAFRDAAELIRERLAGTTDGAA